MIDINARAARAKLATLPRHLKSQLDGLEVSWAHALETADSMRSDYRTTPPSQRHADLCAAVAECALNAAIVAAFEPLTVHDHSGDVARILGGDV